MSWLYLWSAAWLITNWFFYENNEAYWRRLKSDTRRRWWAYKLTIPPVVATAVTLVCWMCGGFGA